nr:response regulator transcription factor [Sphingomonas sp. QA11]
MSTYVECCLEYPVAFAARILIADGHPLVREGLVLVARSVAPSIVIDTAGTVIEAEALARLHRSYRLAILDSALPGSFGFSGFLQIQRQLGPVPIVILSASAGLETVETARALGAVGYFLKTWPVDELTAALRRVLEGIAVFPLPGAVADGRAQDAQRDLRKLSDAQLRVLLALADGRSNKQIAGDLGVTEATIKAHLSASFRKLGVQNRAQALLAMQPLLHDRNLSAG